MLRNYIKIAFRSLKRNMSYSAINILGLSIGISFSVLLYMHVKNELASDKFHSKSDRLVRVVSIDERVPDKVRQYGQCPPPMAPALKTDYPEVEDVVRLFRYTGQVVFKMDDQNFQEREWYVTDNNFFSIFDFEFVAGDPSTVLSKPFSVVLNETTARQYFGNGEVVGQIIDFSSIGPVTITGVIKDAPDNSHLKFNMLFSGVRPDEDWKKYMSNWQSFGAYSYLLLKDNNSLDALKQKMPDFRGKYFGPLAEVFDVDFQPIEDIYFQSSNIESGVEQTHGSIFYVYIFATLGIFLLVIACINYINLATSKAMFRAKEIGIRKVVGAIKKQLIAQFLTEAFVVTLLAMIIAIGIIDLIIPYFNMVTGKVIIFNLTTLGEYLLPLLGIATLIALLSGAYPAFYLAQLQPSSTLRGEQTSGKNSATFRKSLVIFQFALTIIMIVSTIVISRQLEYIQIKDVGFDKERLIVIDINSGNVRNQFQAMKNEFSQIPGVENVGVSSRVPGEWKRIRQLFMKRTGYQPDESAIDSIETYYMGFDEDMLDTYDFKLLTGRYFAENGQNDSTKVLLNETAVKTLGLKDPIGATIELSSRSGSLKVSVIGVLKDFNFQSLHQKITPMIIAAWNNPVQSIDYFTLKTTGNVSEILAKATLVHEKFDSFTPMEYHFLDKQIATFYEADERVARVFNLGAGLSIFVACLGLFGLASFTVEKKRKELGVRKILGASESQLFFLLSSSFAKQIGIAFIIACPIAYYAMTTWLEAFQYRITLGVGVFLISGFISLAIALLTISYRSVKAVNRNPVDSLRYE